MKKHLSIVLSLALLTLPVSATTVLAAGEDTTSSDTIVTSDTQVQETDSSQIDDGITQPADGSVTNEQASDDSVTDETTTDDTVTDDTVADDTVTDDTTTDDTATDDTVTDDTASDDTVTDTATDETATDENNESTDGQVVDEEGTEVDAGVTPDSPLYWFDQLLEKIKLALTFDVEKKAELIQEQAAENLAEAQLMAEEGNEEEAEVALSNYSKKVESALAFIAEIQEEDSAKAEKLEQALSRVNTNNIVVLGGLIEKLPPQAAQRVALNVVKSMEKAIVKMEKKEQREIKKNLKNVQEFIDEDSLEEEAKAEVAQFRKALEDNEADDEGNDTEDAELVENNDNSKMDNSTVTKKNDSHGKVNAKAFDKKESSKSVEKEKDNKQGNRKSDNSGKRNNR